MRFRNTKSGLIVDAPSMLRGNWERIDGDTPAKKAETVAVPSEPTPETKTEVKSAKKRTSRKTKK